MKKFNITLAVLMIVLAIGCKKNDIKPLKPDLKQQLIDCRKCGGGWDLTDSIPDESN